jgi:hypothetical protein
MQIQPIENPFSFPQAYCGLFTVVALVSVIVADAAQADSVTGKRSHNGVALFAASRAAFEPVDGGMPRESAGEGPGLAHPNAGPASELVHMHVVLPDPPITPGDEARLDLLNRFEFGAPFGSVPDDRWTFRVHGTASAVDAQLSGVDADALVSALGRATFFVDPIIEPVGTTVGQIILDAVRPLTPKETELGATIAVRLLEDGMPRLELGAGSASMSFPIVVGRGYEIVATYDLFVPHGVDPPFQVELGATIAPMTFGDYNGSGVIDAPDYVVWRKSLGQPNAPLVADGNGNGQIDPGDYDVWRANFGRSVAVSSAAGLFGSASIPEPQSIVFACSLLVLFVITHGRRGATAVSITAIARYCPRTSAMISSKEPS